MPEFLKRKNVVNNIFMRAIMLKAIFCLLISTCWAKNSVGDEQKILFIEIQEKTYTHGRWVDVDDKRMVVGTIIINWKSKKIVISSGENFRYNLYFNNGGYDNKKNLCFDTFDSDGNDSYLVIVKSKVYFHYNKVEKNWTRAMVFYYL